MLYIVIGKIFQYRNNPFLFEGRKSEIMDKQHNIRNSGIESIKILAIILIIIGHTVQTAFPNAPKYRDRLKIKCCMSVVAMETSST